MQSHVPQRERRFVSTVGAAPGKWFDVPTAVPAERGELPCRRANHSESLQTSLPFEPQAISTADQAAMGANMLQLTRDAYPSLASADVELMGRQLEQFAVIGEWLVDVSLPESMPYNG